MAALDPVTEGRLRAAVRAASRRGQVVAAYLFGSRAEGRGDAWSDYDLAVFVEGAEAWDLPRVARFCGGIQKEAGDDIEPHVFPASAFREPEVASFAAFILKTGVRLPLEELAA